MKLVVDFVCRKAKTLVCKVVEDSGGSVTGVPVGVSTCEGAWHT